MKKLIFIFLLLFTTIGYSQNNYCDVYYTPNNQNEEFVENKTNSYTSYELRINRFHRNHFNWSYWHISNFYYTFYWYYHPFYLYHHHWFLPRGNYFWYWHRYNHFHYSWNYRNVWYFGSPFRYNWYYSNIIINWNRNNDNVHYGPRNVGGSTVGHNRLNETNRTRNYRRPELTIDDYRRRVNLREEYSSRNTKQERNRNTNVTPQIYRDERNIRRSDNKRSLSPTERNVRSPIQRESINRDQRNSNINRQPARRTPTNVNRSAPPSNRRGTSNSSRSSSSTRRRN